MNCKEIKGLPNSKVLMAFTDAFMRRDDDALAVARKDLLDAMGWDAVIEAAGTASNFQRMTRIADCLSLNPIEDWMDGDEEGAAEERRLMESLGFNDIASTTNPKFREV